MFGDEALVGGWEVRAGFDFGFEGGECGGGGHI